MVNTKEERWFYFALFMAIILQITCLSLEWTYAKYPLRFSKSKYIEQLDLQSGYPFFGSEFKGGIVSCFSGCNNTFQIERDDWCEVSDYLNKNCPGCIEENASLSLCKLFTNQYTIGVIFAVFSTFFMLGQFIYAFLGFADARTNFRKKDKFCKIFNACALIIAVFSMFMCWILWLALGLTSSVVIGDNCKEFPTDGSVPGVCASYGLYFGLVCLVYNSIVYIWGLSFKFRKYFKRAKKPPKLNVNIQNKTHQEYPISKYAMEIVYEPEVKEGQEENSNEGRPVSDLP